MKHLVRDCFIWIMSILGVTALYCSRKKKKNTLVRVLCFHDVPNQRWFESLIDTLHTHYNLISPSQFHNKDFHPGKINILLTFDDGYKSWTDIVLPVLTQYKVQGLFFICSGLLDIAEKKSEVDIFMKEQLNIFPKEALTWEGASRLISAGHSIGGHTNSHPNLVDISAIDVQKEIMNDKERIEQKLNIKLTDFAYPFGTKSHYTSELQKQVSSAGYTYIYNAKTGFLGNNMLDVHRTLIEKQQPIVSVRRWIKGGYDIFALCKGV